MNAMEKTVDLLLCIGLIFIMPLLYFDSQRRVAQAMLTGNVAQRFLDRISVEGEITLDDWTKLEGTLHKMGCTSYELQRQYSLYEPEKEGKVRETVYRLETEKIADCLEKKGTMALRKGDTVRICLYCGEIPAIYSVVVRTGGGKR